MRSGPKASSRLRPAGGILVLGFAVGAGVLLAELGELGVHVDHGQASAAAVGEELPGGRHSLTNGVVRKLPEVLRTRSPPVLASYPVHDVGFGQGLGVASAGLPEHLLDVAAAAGVPRGLGQRCQEVFDKISPEGSVEPGYPS